MRPFVPLSLLALLISALPLVGQSGPAAVRENLREWVDVQKTISAEETDWKAEQAIMGDMLSLLRAESERLTERIDSAREAMNVADDKRAELNAEREAYRAAVDFLASRLGELEASIRELVVMLPEPLTEEIAPLLQRLPEANAEEVDVPLTQRLQTVVGILSQAEKFNSAVSLIVETMPVGEQRREVRTLYFGLAGAFFADPAGTYAGIGAPAANGWEWSETPDAAPRIADLIAMYENTREAAFVVLPVQL